MAPISRPLLASLAGCALLGRAALSLAQPSPPPAAPPGASAAPPGVSTAPTAAPTAPTAPPTAPVAPATAPTQAPPPGTAPAPSAPGMVYPPAPPGAQGSPAPAASAYPGYPGYPGYPYYPPPPGSPPGAAPGYSPPPPPPVPLPAPRERPGKFLHNGFYLQISAGLVSHRNSLKIPDSTADATVRGLGLGYDIALGGNLSRSLVLAGALGSHTMNSSLTNNNTGLARDNVGLDYTAVSLRVDWYPDPAKGFHVQGGVGSAQYRLNRIEVRAVRTEQGRQTFDLETMNGTHFMLGVGYETFVDSEWSIGLLARLEAANFSQTEEPRVSGTMIAPSLRLSFTYH